MNTVQTYKFFDEMSPSQIDDFNLMCQNRHDIEIIYGFLNPVPPRVPASDIAKHNYSVTLRARLDLIIKAIRDYERENKENFTCDMENN